MQTITLSLLEQSPELLELLHVSRPLSCLYPNLFNLPDSSVPCKTTQIMTRKTIFTPPHVLLSVCFTPHLQSSVGGENINLNIQIW